MRSTNPRRKSRSRYLAAVVLGTALATFGGAQKAGAAESGQAINDISRYCSACWRNAWSG